MAGLFASKSQHSDFFGLSSIFEYTNDDGTLCNTNCGQAAAATLLTHLGKFAPLADQARQVMHLLEKTFPPDNFFGLLGTSRRRVERICRANGAPVRPVVGRDALCARLRAGLPVIVMLGVSGGRFLNRDLPGGHWMVACGYDAERIYLTNWGTMPWPEFDASWNKLVPRLINMHGKGLATS